jgi:hypothetical protein
VIDQRLANPSRIRNRGLLADPDAVVDDAAKVFDEMTVQVGRDGGDRLADGHLDP